MRKPHSQPSLASLTQADREQLAEWLRRHTYDEVIELVRPPRPEGFGLTLSRKPLQTFNAKVVLFDLINSRLPDDKKLTLETFESLACGALLLPSAQDQNRQSEICNLQCEKVHTTILNATADLAASGENSPAQLLALQRLADFPARAALRAQRLQLDLAKAERAAERHGHRLEMDAFRQQTAEKRLDLAERTFAFRQKQHEDRLALAREKLSRSAQPQSAICHPPSEILSDHLGPYATNWDEAGERCRLQFGISKEDWAARQALFDKPLPFGALGEDLGNGDGAPPAPEPPVPPVRTRAEIVDAYSVQCLHKYWAWRQKKVGNSPNSSFS